jgi:plasmid rolling circle replication initiator protein Rep
LSNELYQKKVSFFSVEQEIKEKFKFLDELDFLVKKYNSFKVFELYQNFASEKKLNALADCGTFLGFDLYQNISNQEYKKKLSNANFCKDRFCEVCNWRRARKFAIQNFQTLKTIQMNEKVRYIFATFTIKNPLIYDLKENIKLFNKAWDRMTRTKRWKNSILGYIKAIEIPFQKTDKRRINLHAHCLIVVPSVYFDFKNYDLYIKQNEFQEMWKKALRVDYSPGVDIRIIKANKNRNEDNEIASVVAETTKYPLKSVDLNGINWKVFQVLTEEVKGMRFVSFGGIVREYRLKLFGNVELDDDDLIYSVDDDLDDLFWRYIGKLWYLLDEGKYVLYSFDEDKLQKNNKLIKKEFENERKI